MAAMKRQRGMVLLPVTLALAIVGAMSASAVDAQYDTERARYLAEAGVNLLKWRNEQSSCSSAQGFVSPFTGLEGGTITSSGVSNKKSILGMTLTATTTRGTVNKVVLDEKTGVALHDLSQKSEITISAQNGSDGFIRRDPVAGDTTSAYLETTDGNAHGLIKFDLGTARTGAMITEATLRLYLGSIQSTQAGTLGVHRMLRAWPLLMNWTNGWTNPGGDFSPQPSNLYATPLAAATTYTTRIDGVVQGWATQPAINLGLLLKPTGLLAARFNSFEAATNQPQIFLRYYPLCK
jgi:hypothetical protein